MGLFNQNSYGEQVRSYSESVARTIVKNSYLWMTAALAVSAATAWSVFNSYAIFNLIFGHSGVLIGLIIAEFAVVIIFSSRIDRLSFSTASLLFVAYSALTGLTLSSIFFVYELGSIVSTFLISAAMFGSAAVYGMITDKDLSSWGSIFFTALIGLIIASVVNIFVASSAFDWIVSFVGVILFVGLAAYDSQKIKFIASQVGEVNESTLKISLWGALNLYLDFINIFLYLLRFLGNRK